MPKHIPLSSRKHPGLSALVSDEDFDRLRPYRWHYARGYVYRTAYVEAQDDRQNAPPRSCMPQKDLRSTTSTATRSTIGARTFA